MLRILLQVVAGVVVADVIIASFHWFEDTYFHYCMTAPIVSIIARENEMHHFYPRDILAFSVWSNMQWTVPIALVVALVACLAFPSLYKRYPWALGAAMVVGMTANVLHRFAHKRDCELPPPPARWLYTSGLMVSHAHHAVHHADPRRRFGVVLCATNWVLDTLCAWRVLEAVLGVFGLRAQHKRPYAEYADIQTARHAEARGECPDVISSAEVGRMYSVLDSAHQCS